MTLYVIDDDTLRHVLLQSVTEVSLYALARTATTLYVIDDDTLRHST
jgi:hypothetical protein